MAPVKADPAKVRGFKEAASFYTWLAKNHDTADEVWIKIHKLGSGLKSITQKEAIDVVLCWGWIEGICKRFDEAVICSATRRAARRASGARSTSRTSRGSSKKGG